MNLKDIQAEVENENKQIEELAFKMFCKDKVAQRLSAIKEDEERLEKSRKKLEDLTLENLTLWFNEHDYCQRADKKESFINKAKQQLSL